MMALGRGISLCSFALLLAAGCEASDGDSEPDGSEAGGKADETEDACDFAEDDPSVCAELGCTYLEQDGVCVEPIRDGEVTVLEVYDVDPLNEGLDPTVPTADVAFYLTEGGRIQWSSMLRGIDNAREVFGVVGVQLKVVYAVKLAVPENWQRLDASLLSEPRSGPEQREIDLYAHLDEEAAVLTDRNTQIFDAMVRQFPAEELGLDPANTVHILNLSSVPLSYYEYEDGEWVLDTVGTGGLSFPPYMHGDRIPRHLRGAITMSGPGPLAHELGHKLINVSHEGVGACPAFEAYGDDLMLYGSGSRIPAGADGRWQVERLHVSPFVYRVEDQAATFNRDFIEGGRYADPIYGTYVVDPVCG